MSYCYFHALAAADSRDGELRPLSIVFRATSALIILYHGIASQSTCQLQTELHRRIGSWGSRPAAFQQYISLPPAELHFSCARALPKPLRPLISRIRQHAMVQIMPRGQRENGKRGANRDFLFLLA